MPNLVQAGPASQPWLFSQLCLQCSGPVTAAFCSGENCRRKFVPLPGYSRRYCPVDDPAMQANTAEFRARKIRDAVHCPNCGNNLYGVKPEDA